MMRNIHRKSRAFSLIEILVVLTIMSILMGVGMKAFSGQGSQEFTNGITSISGTLELGQAQALSSRALVKILIASDNNDLILLPLSFNQSESSSSTSSNSYSSSASDESNEKNWTPLSKPVVVRNMKSNDEFVPETEGFITLSEKDSESVKHVVAGKEIEFTSAIQFTPTGEVTINGSTKISRGFQWGLQSIGAKPKKAILRVSGLTGRVETLREEDFNNSSK